MKYYRRHVIVKIPSDIPAAQHQSIHAKAAELNARFAKDEGGSKLGCIESAAVAIAQSGFGACLIPDAVLITHGGKRAGSGRPKLAKADRAEALTIRAHPSAVAKFKTYCAHRGQSHRQAFELIVGRLF